MTKPVRHKDGDGLFLFLRPSGSVSWVLRVQRHGKRQDIGLGPYPRTTLASARKAADKMRSDLAEDKSLTKIRQAEIPPSSPPTFAEMAVATRDTLAPGWGSRKHTTQWLRSLEDHVFPAMGHFPVNEIKPRDVADAIGPIMQTRYETGKRLRQRVQAVLDYAHAKGHRDVEAPRRAIGKLLVDKRRGTDGHFASMPYDKVPTFLERLRGSSGMSAMALQFAILTAARSGEVRHATRDEISLTEKTWHIPGTRMKEKKDHAVPLSKEALALVQEILRSHEHRHLFPNRKGMALSDMALLKSLKSNGGENYTVHGFRSTFKVWCAEQTDHADELSEAALAHQIPNEVVRAYKRTTFFDRRRTLMEDWAGFLKTP